MFSFQLSLQHLDFEFHKSSVKSETEENKNNKSNNNKKQNTNKS